MPTTPRFEPGLLATVRSAIDAASSPRRTENLNFVPTGFPLITLSTCTGPATFLPSMATMTSAGASLR